MATSPLTEFQISTIKQQLETLCLELHNQLQQSDESTRPVTLDQQSVGRVSRIDAIQQQQMATANHQQTNASLQKALSAIKRINNGNYGTCQTCDEPIAFARLQAQPYTLNCVTCQSELE